MQASIQQTRDIKINIDKTEVMVIVKKGMKLLG